MLFEWRDTLAVGHGAIDRQHRELVRLVNELETVLTGGGDGAAVFDQLALRAHEHFATEHACFDRWHFPGAGLHREEHARLEQQLEEYRRRSGVSLELLGFVSGWMRRHFEQTDMRYRSFIPEDERA